ncbi:MAG TPA: 16S rRNA (cytidine(1402)-2'-O)-methyltransferase [Ktedonobacterales bacterium]|nr:16S rRNA (cytidine(1402)-2'-O)-methyltransferase [Ktedonobacterales bacterium]
MGTLYLVATPLGNLEDITLRALRILRESRLIAAEDTRHTRKLLNHFEIATPTISYHEHSGPVGIAIVLVALAEGDVALVSDAGTPAISDPGADLVSAALAAAYPVTPIPGPSAVITALIASGLPTDQFTFLGFLPRKTKERRALLSSVRDEPRTLVLYEAPHRLRACLDDLLAVLGDRDVCLARELTKVHEEWLRGSLSSLRAHYTREEPRGEYTLVIAGAQDTSRPESEMNPTEREATVRERLRVLLSEGNSTRDAAAQVAGELGISRRDAYRLALEVAAESAEE